MRTARLFTDAVHSRGLSLVGGAVRGVSRGGAVPGGLDAVQGVGAVHNRK